MSVTIRTTIACDGMMPACTGAAWAADLRHLSATEQRKIAKQERGWTRLGGKDYCRECWEQMTKRKP